jgi:hypothetical protein
MVSHTCIPSTQEQSEEDIEIENSLGYIVTFCLKNFEQNEFRDQSFELHETSCITDSM